MMKARKIFKRTAPSTAFKPGHKKVGGRKPGSPNKFTTLKQAFVEAFQELGGVVGLVEWVQKNSDNRAHFYSMIAKMLPKEMVLTNEGDTPETLPFVVRIQSQ